MRGVRRGRGGGEENRGMWHFDARIMDLAPAAAIVKKNKRLGERPSQEFNAAHEKRGKIQKTNTAAALQGGLSGSSGNKRLLAGEKGG